MYPIHVKGQLNGDIENPNAWWNETSEIIRKAGREILGITSGRKKSGKETWWWNETVQKAISNKKEAKKCLDFNLSEENKHRYKVAKKQAKKAVAESKSAADSEFYFNIQTDDGRSLTFKVAKIKDKKSKDITRVHMIRNKEGTVLTKDSDIKERWIEYFSELLNTENSRKPINDEIPNQALTERMSEAEVRIALSKMKNGKATGPDEIPIEAWRVLGERAVCLLTKLAQRVFYTGKMPEEWRKSTLVPIFKQKGDVQACSNYRGIKLMCHTLKLYERIIDKRPRSETTIGENQRGFMPGRSGTEAIFALRQLYEKCHEKQRELHAVFIDLEKAYDTVP